MKARLGIVTDRSLLQSSLRAETIGKELKTLGYEAAGLADRHTLAAAPVFERACRAVGILPVLGARVCIGRGWLTGYAESIYGWESLCWAVSLGRRILLPEAESMEGVVWVSHCGWDEPAQLPAGTLESIQALAWTRGEKDDGALTALRSLSGGTSLVGASALRHWYEGVSLGCDDQGEVEDEIVSRCAGKVSLARPASFASPPTGGVHDEDDAATVLRESCEAELERRLLPAAYRARLEEELSVITNAGFCRYMLLVRDVVRQARSMGVAIGPGRGSASGALVCWLLGITELDPIAYGLLFERFLNRERVSLPDIDLDVRHDKRDQVLAWLRRVYGAEQVLQIGTIQRLSSRGVLRRLMRVDGYTRAEEDRVMRAFPAAHRGKPPTLMEGAKHPPFRDVIDADPRFKELFRLGLSVEGMSSHRSKHAAGVVILAGDSRSEIPTIGDTIAYSMEDAELCGLIKFDLLGLKTLTAVCLCEDQGITIPAGFDDPAVYEMLREKDTAGVFQIENRSAQRVLKSLAPDSFVDLIAAVALNRPGPLDGKLDRAYAARKSGREPVSYPRPELEPVLRETYGVWVYQEQVLEAARVLCGYTLAEADLLRRAMGKKKPEEMAKHRARWAAAGHEEVFGQIEQFAGYGFNKSHAAAYAVLSYRTAWLKLYHPEAFFAALLQVYRENSKRWKPMFLASLRWGIRWVGPSLNRSRVEHLGVSGTGEILLGLHTIGAVAGTTIAKARGESTWESVQECLAAVPRQKVNKAARENIERYCTL